MLLNKFTLPLSEFIRRVIMSFLFLIYVMMLLTFLVHVVTSFLSLILHVMMSLLSST